MTETPKSFFPMATPEDVKKASEQAMNLWIGALSPMWVPFMAASAFGMSAYAAGKTLQKDLVGDLPLAPRWPGFAPLWGQTDFTPQAFEQSVLDAAQAVEDAFAPVEAAAESLMQATVESVAAMTAAASPVDVVVAAAEPEPVIEPVAEVAEVAVFADVPVVDAPAIEPQDIEAPVVDAPVVEAVALTPKTLAPETLAPETLAPKTLAPKTLAKDLAVAKAKPKAAAATKAVSKSKPKA